MEMLRLQSVKYTKTPSKLQKKVSPISPQKLFHKSAVCIVIIEKKNLRNVMKTSDALNR